MPDALSLSEIVRLALRHYPFPLRPGKKMIKSILESAVAGARLDYFVPVDDFLAAGSI